MTGYKEALGWFYQWDRSKIAGTELEQRLHDIFNPAISDADREGLLRSLKEEYENSEILPELLFQIGAWYRRHGALRVGLKYLDQAIAQYSSAMDIHHLISLHWLYGCILREIGCNLQACLHWRNAVNVWKEYLSGFQVRQQEIDVGIENARLASLRCIEREEWHRKELGKNPPEPIFSKHKKNIATHQRKAQQWQTKVGELKKTKQGVESTIEWYQKRLGEMEVALICTPEEAYLLVKDMSAQDHTRLSRGFSDQRELIEQLIVTQKPADVVKEVERMLAVAGARSSIDGVETYLVSGWALYQVEDENWEKKLGKAIFLSPTGSLVRIWARWILGAIQWNIPNKVSEAATNWTIAIEDLTQLEKEAMWQNQTRMVNLSWDKLTIMRGALYLQRNKLSEAMQAGP